MALLVMFSTREQARTRHLPHILEYIRILTRIGPKTRILTTPGRDALPRDPADSGEAVPCCPAACLP